MIYQIFTTKTSNIDEAERIAALSSGKIDNYEYLRCEEILPSDQSRAIEQARFICSSLGRALEKQKKQLMIKKENMFKS